MDTCEFKDREVKLFRPCYDTTAGHFQGLNETLGYIMVCGDEDEHFTDSGFCKQNSKILYSHHKKRISSNFSGTFFKRQRTQCETGALNTNFSEAFFFCPRLLTVSRKLKGIWLQ